MVAAAAAAGNRGAGGGPHGGFPLEGAIFHWRRHSKSHARQTESLVASSMPTMVCHGLFGFIRAWGRYLGAVLGHAPPGSNQPIVAMGWQDFPHGSLLYLGRLG